ncbi:MAG: serine/threonine protein kinase, partial [Promethearchaeota archaeon]
MKSNKIALGIESTAHTWGVGLVDFTGKVLSLVNDVFIPKKGGLHPALVREQHLNNFMEVINKALTQAKCSIKDINLLAFSQSPGLGPVLKIGALVARMLGQLLKIPIIGVNHCIAHIEIGRLVCNID